MSTHPSILARGLALAALLALAGCGGSGGATPPTTPPIIPPPPGGDRVPPTVEVFEPSLPSALIPGDALTVAFRVEDNVGATVEVVLDADGDSGTTADQISLWSGGDRSGTPQEVTLETDQVAIGSYVLFVIADDGTNAKVAVGEPATTGVVTYPALAGVLLPRRNVYGVTGRHVVFAVGETEQGNSDRNQDGDTSDGVMSQIDATTGAEIRTLMTTDVRTTAVQWARVLPSSTEAIFWERREADEGRSLNMDGDLLDTMVSFTAPLHDVPPTANLIGGASLTDLGVTATRIVTYRERDEGKDLNFDGDTVDTVVSLLDVKTNTLAHTFLLAPRLSAPIVGQGSDIVYCVDEAIQGLGNRGIDLNLDGDTADTLPFTAELETYASGVSGVDVDPTGGYSTFGDQTGYHYYADEAAAGIGPINPDGDATDFVPAIMTGTTPTIPVGIPGPPPLNAGAGAPVSFCYGSLCVFTAAEEGLGDRNNDGDTTDLQVLQWVSIDDDINGARGVPVDVGGLASLTLDGGAAATVAPGWISMAVSETANSVDLNGDGDPLDVVLMLMDLSGDAPVLYSVDLAPLAAGGALPVGATSIPQTGIGDDRGLVFQVVETANGDLNGDGDITDTLLFYVAYEDPTNPVQLANTGALHVAVAGDCVGVTTHELLTMQDFNDDGDTTDVLFRVIATDGQVLEAGRHSLPGSVPATDDGTVWCYLRAEFSEDRDLNGDGDTVDPILGIWLHR